MFYLDHLLLQQNGRRTPLQYIDSTSTGEVNTIEYLVKMAAVKG